MHGLVADADGSLAWTERPTPEPAAGQIRLRVVASGLNRADLSQRAGTYPPPPGVTDVLGLEAAGVVEAVGAGVEAWHVGDRAMALLAGGGHATHVVCPAGHLLPVPEAWSFHEAAAFPEVFATAWLNLVREGRLSAGERVLLHAGASGVGTAAIQVCAARGARCWVVVGSPEKLAACVALGAEGGVDRHTARFADHAPAWTDRRGFDVILDPVGGSTLEDDVGTLANGGRLVVIGLLGGRYGRLDLGRLLVKRLTVVGSVLRSRADAEKTEILDGLWRELGPLAAAGRLRPVIDRVLPRARADEAFATLASDRTIGKIILDGA